MAVPHADMALSRMEVPREPVPLRRSLRAKGFVATLGLMLFMLGSAIFVAIERSQIYESMQELQQISRHDKALTLAEAAVNSAAVDVSLASNAGGPNMPPSSELTLYMESCVKLFSDLEEFDPAYALLERSITRSFDVLKSQPVRANWIDLRESLARASQMLEIRRQRLGIEREGLTLSYQRQYDAVTIESLLLSLTGIAVFGALVAWFFARLTGDIRALEAHARHIVHGSRGLMLSVQRDDELGRLMQAVNRMSIDLDEREKRIALDTERRAHEDKMMAVGALAAGVAHEVNNPLASISGIAQALFSSQDPLPVDKVNAAAQSIMEQTQRAAGAARNLALLAAPQPSEYDWVDFNALVRKVLQLMSYDKRYRHLGHELALDPQLPAIRFPASTVQQVLMQLASLGCEAMTKLEAPNTALRVSTAVTRRCVTLTMRFPTQLDFARPEVSRVLLLAPSQLESLGGRFELHQLPDLWTEMCVTLPMTVDGDKG